MRRGVLFVHNNFPGQFGDLARFLVARGTPCAGIGQNHSGAVEGVEVARYALSHGTAPGIFPLAVRAEADLIRAWGAYRMGRDLKAKGWDPAVIVGHPGWGEMTLLEELFPNTPQVAFAEFYYRPHGFDVGFDAEFFARKEDDDLRVIAKNPVMAQAYANAAAIVAPTRFQASTLPSGIQANVRIIHEGVDVEALRPGPAQPFTLPDGRVIAPGTPVITHINNNMEPLRGLHIFARALPRLLAEIPQAQVLIIGKDTKSAYGGVAPDDLTWREVCFRDVEVDPGRVHFLGKIPHTRMLDALRLSTAHVYYTYPFVLSWSLVEAMSLGCYVIGSDTAPLHDAVEDGVNGRLLPFFDVEALSEAMIAACRDPQASAPLRAAARVTAVERFSREKGRAAWLSLLAELGL